MFDLQNVERSFALLLLRFPRLNKLNQQTLVKKLKVVMAACILHNICILENDNIAFYLQRAQMVTTWDIRFLISIYFKIQMLCKQ